jgi:hypothetical protein
MNNQKNNYVLYFNDLQNEPQQLPVNCTRKQLGELLYVMTVKNYVVTVEQIKTAHND